MSPQEFANIFLPSLAYSYECGEVPFHALVDFEFWQQLFPRDAETVTRASKAIVWSEIQLNAFALPDGTLLLIYTLPNPRNQLELKFVGLRVDRHSRHVVCYQLRRPMFYDELWDILYKPLPDGEARYALKVNGTWSLRNFWLTIEGEPFNATYDE